MTSNITDDQIAVAFENTNFGRDDLRILLQQSVLKKLVGYHCGHTITVIMQELNLIGKHGDVTKKGKKFVAHAYGYLMMGGV